MNNENNGKITLAVIKNDLEYIKMKQRETDEKIANLANSIERKFCDHDERIREMEIRMADLKPLKGLVYGVLTALISTAVLYSIFFFATQR